MRISATAVTALIALVPAYVSAAAVAKRALLTGQWDTESEVSPSHILSLQLSNPGQLKQFSLDSVLGEIVLTE